MSTKILVAVSLFVLLLVAPATAPATASATVAASSAGESLQTGGAIADGTVVAAELRSAVGDFDAERALILAETNQLRAANGLAPLVLNAALNTVAQDWSEQQALSSTMSHRPDFTSVFPVGWTYAAENVAFGYRPADVVDAWAASPGHRRNLLSATTHIGIGVAANSSGRLFYTQNFARYPSTPPVPPQAPVGLAVTVNDGAVLTLDWDAPVSAGTSPVSGYVVQFRRATSTVWSTAAGGPGTATTFTFVRPTPGVAFVFRVVARSAAGVGAWSTPVLATTLVPVLPSAPVGVAVTVNDGAVLTLDWDAPVSAGTSPVSGYVVQFRRATSTVWSTAAGGPGTATTFTFVRPTPGVAFVFRVVARSAAGVGAWSTPVSATTLVPVLPSAPVGLAVTVNDGAVLTLDWDAPASAGTSPVSGYVVQFRRATSTVWNAAAGGSVTDSTFTFVRPTAGVAFVFRVVARSAAGVGAWSTPVSATIPVSM